MKTATDENFFKKYERFDREAAEAFFQQLSERYSDLRVGTEGDERREVSELVDRILLNPISVEAELEEGTHPFDILRRIERAVCPGLLKLAQYIDIKLLQEPVRTFVCGA